VSYETRPLAEVNEAIAEVLHGKARGRLVLEPCGTKVRRHEQAPFLDRWRRKTKVSRPE
jgi:hypothetical protein